MTIALHRHHVIPRHMGGSDSADNLVLVSIEEHALTHKQLYEKFGKSEDYIAWKALSGQIDKADIQLEKSRLGGKIASQSVQGDKNHFYGKTHTEEFKKSQSELKKKTYVGSGNPNAKSINYNGIEYSTMKEMQKATGISLYKIRKLLMTAGS